MCVCVEKVSAHVCAQCSCGTIELEAESISFPNPPTPQSGLDDVSDSKSVGSPHTQVLDLLMASHGTSYTDTDGYAQILQNAQVRCEIKYNNGAIGSGFFSCLSVVLQRPLCSNQTVMW